jgi:hypothetical protein
VRCRAEDLVHQVGGRVRDKVLIGEFRVAGHVHPQPRHRPYPAQAVQFPAGDVEQVDRALPGAGSRAGEVDLGAHPSGGDEFAAGRGDLAGQAQHAADRSGRRRHGRAGTERPG